MFWKLKNLERIGHVRDTRHTWHGALGFLVCGRAALKVLLPPRQRPWLVRNLVSLDDPLSGRDS